MSYTLIILICANLGGPEQKCWMPEWPKTFASREACQDDLHVAVSAIKARGWSVRLPDCAPDILVEASQAFAHLPPLPTPRPSSPNAQ